MADNSDLDRQIEQLKRCEIIKESEVKQLCARAREILVEESNVQRVDSPVTVSPTSFNANVTCYYVHIQHKECYAIGCIAGVRRYTRTVLRSQGAV